MKMTIFLFIQVATLFAGFVLGAAFILHTNEPTIETRVASCRDFSRMISDDRPLVDGQISSDEVEK